MTPLTTPEQMRAAVTARGHADAVVDRVPRLLGLDGHGVRGARAAPGAARRGDLDRRDQRGATAAEQRVPWEALDAVQDEWCEYLEISHWVAPPADLLAELAPAARDSATPDRLRPGGVRVHPRPASRYVAGRHRGHHRRGRGVGGQVRRLPGLRAPHARRAARGRHPGPLRVGLPAPVAPTRSSARRSPASRTPGSSGGTASGSASTRPTPARPTSTTSSSPGAATTPTSRRCAASTPPAATPSCSSRSRSPACADLVAVRSSEHADLRRLRATAQRLRLAPFPVGLLVRISGLDSRPTTPGRGSGPPSRGRSAGPRSSPHRR